ncbi:hypothetical protein OZL46_14120 [Bacillus sonorensis]|uniref:hypothetical protein n=1 Tax=Bacillus sonorensis TaxID=119858 RepID=UPI00228307EA|nr:hypothetical protein [Bacillus sonorensis]MCY8087241.1 hypothetical protein [Bacillus sonorensis]MCZ0069561.1 hypothetical protein [Bacillus sonorensis]MCZ0096950.1 hypothetical protein [Bacillus sonorensis]MEC1517628.1 hypothetical protein [Bacillus sonorensis]
MSVLLKAEDKKRSESQKNTILTMLREAGTTGVKNSELLKVALRYSSVIHLLRKDGHLIEMINNEAGTLRYTLVGFEEPVPQVNAYEKLFDLVAEHDKVTTAQLLSILKQNNICFKLSVVREGI